MVVLIDKNHPCFDLEQAYRYFEINRENLQDTNGFVHLLRNSRFFNIYHHGYVGSVFVYESEDGRHWIGGYAKRKHHQEVVEAICRVADMFDEVWAHTSHLNAVIALKKSGFKWVSRKHNLLKRKQKGKNMSSNVKAKPQTFSSGLYGSATTGKNGTTYNPSAFEQQLMGMTKQYIPQYLQQMANPTYDSAVFKAQTAQRNRLANQSFANNLLNPLASRGLTRGSSINQMSNQFANKLADLEVDAMANEDMRTAKTLNNLMTYYQMPYEMMSGISSFSNNQYQQAMQNAMQQNQNRHNQMMDYANILSGGQFGKSGQSLGSAGQPSTSWQQGAGRLAGAGIGGYFGGPVGAQLGSSWGGMFGNYFS